MSYENLKWKPTAEISFNFSPCCDSSLSCVCSPRPTVCLQQTIKRKSRGISEECVCISLVIASLLPLISWVKWWKEHRPLPSDQWFTTSITQAWSKWKILCYSFEQTTEFITHTDGCLYPIMRLKERQSKSPSSSTMRIPFLFFLLLKTTTGIFRKTKKETPQMTPLLLKSFLICCYGYSFRPLPVCFFYSELFAVIPQCLALGPLAKEVHGKTSSLSIRGPQEDRQRKEGIADSWKHLCMCLSTEKHKNPREQWANFWLGNKGGYQLAFSAIGCLA